MNPTQENKQTTKRSVDNKTSRTKKHANPYDRIKGKFWMLLTLALLGYIVVTQLYDFDLSISQKGARQTQKAEAALSDVESPQTEDIISTLQNDVLPAEGFEIPITWGDLGKQMVEAGVIDVQAFREVFGSQLAQDQEEMLSGEWNQPVHITQDNSRFLLNLFWALGLGNQNRILTEGDMSNETYGGAGNFASTGGWTLASGDAMDHYSKYSFVTLTQEQQNVVEEVSKGIFRPCCGNSTYFPDCNHGMAMLGLMELMASQNASKEQMYQTALGVNSFWFPQTYLELAAYFKEQGQDWNTVDPKLVLGQEHSSGQGYAQTRAKIKSLPEVQSGGGGCSV